MDDDWKQAWEPVVRAVGIDIDVGGIASPADIVEAGTLRRYLEPLELDCALHHSREAAQAQGYPDVIAPYTAMVSFTLPPMWRPGDPPLFTSAERDAQPGWSAVKPLFPDFFPPFSGYFATDIDMDFLRPVHIGERVARRGTMLVACEPKETRVGRGAFITTETEIVAGDEEVVARIRTGLFLYTPREEEAS